MEKSLPIIDDFYNDDIIVRKSKKTNNKEKVDFYSDKHIKVPGRLTKTVDSGINKLLHKDKINFTYEENPEPAIKQNIFVPAPEKHLTNKQEVMNNYLKKHETTYTHNHPLSEDSAEKIARYKNLLENTSISAIMKNNNKTSMWKNSNLDNIVKEKPAYERIKFFDRIKSLFNFKRRFK